MNRFVNDLTVIMIVSAIVTTTFAALVKLTWRRGKKLQQPLSARLGRRCEELARTPGPAGPDAAGAGPIWPGRARPPRAPGCP